MKSILCAFFVLMSLSSVASAAVTGYRYTIPSTNDQYSIEFPSYFLVLSKDMSNHDPAITVFDVDPFESMDLLNETDSEIMASSEELNMGVFIRVTNLDGNGFSAQEESDDYLSEYADSLAQFFYRHYTNVQPVDPDNQGRLYTADHVKFLYMTHYKEEDGATEVAEEFMLMEKDYMVTLSFLCDTSDREKYERAYDVVGYICDSVIREDTQPGTYDHL